ncbi:MAG: NINE protein [Bacteroidota bacterium]
MCIGFAFNTSANSSIIKTDSTLFAITDTIAINSASKIVPDSLSSKGDFKKKKLVSALFSFPFPFGFMGAHRVMLGAKPWIPVVYVATFGGCFGILPLIDFCVITFGKNLEQYENNPQLFMWIKGSTDNE